MFVDIHTHNKSKYPSIRNLTFPEAERIFNSSEKGLFSVGFHPWFVNEYTPEIISKLDNWSKDNRFFAIGECGLDKNSKVTLEKQFQVFKLQILLSEEIKKPLIIHCVGCFNELLEIKKELNPTELWIIHGFRGKPELAIQVLKSGCALSFGEHFNIESVRITPVDKLFVETDESSMSIEAIYRQISDAKQCDRDQLKAGEQLFLSFLKQFSF